MKCQWCIGLLFSVLSFANQTLPTRVDQLERQMQQVRMKSDGGEVGARFGVHGKPEQRWDISGGVLYWKPTIDNEPYTIATSSSILTLINTAPVYIDLPIRGRALGSTFDFDWGFTVGIGRRLRDSWRLHLEYDRLHTSTSSEVSGGDIRNLSVPSTEINLNTNVTNTFKDGNSAGPIKEQTSLGYDSLRLMLESHLYNSQYLSLAWQIGLRADWMNVWEYVRSDLTIILNNPSASLAPFVGSSRNSWTWELGPCIDFGGNFYLSNWFYFSADFHAGLLYQFAKSSFNYKVLGINNEVDALYRSSDHRFDPVLGMDLGLNCVCNFLKKQLYLSAEYHLEQIFRAYYNIKTDDTAFLNPSTTVPIKIQPVSDPLSFIGLTLKAQLVF